MYVAIFDLLTWSILLQLSAVIGSAAQRHTVFAWLTVYVLSRIQKVSFRMECLKSSKHSFTKKLRRFQIEIPIQQSSCARQLSALRICETDVQLVDLVEYDA